jgi:hypothetical protein
MKYQRLTLALLVVVSVLTVQAQSGRRQTKPPPAAPIPTPTPEPTPVTKETDNKAPELFFFLGANRHFSNANLPYSYYDAALRGCADRLRAGSSASVDVTDKDLSRGEAIKRAKTEGERSYVVHLTLDFDAMARSYDDLVLEYVVFAPGTAKVVTNGRAYMNGRRAGPIVVGPRTRGSNVYREELLRRTGEDAGDRIIKALHLSVQVPK